MATTSIDDNRWHLDRRVPIALILAIFIQTVGAVWWAATATNRLAELEKDTAGTVDRGNRLIRLEVGVETLKETLEKMDGKLDRLNDKS